MDAGRRALAVALGPGGQQGGAAARAPPETDLWVPGPGPGTDMWGFVQTAHPVKTVRGYSGYKRLSDIPNTHTAMIHQLYLDM